MHYGVAHTKHSLSRHWHEYAMHVRSTTGQQHKGNACRTLNQLNAEVWGKKEERKKSEIWISQCFCCSEDSQEHSGTHHSSMHVVSPSLSTWTLHSVGWWPRCWGRRRCGSDCLHSAASGSAWCWTRSGRAGRTGLQSGRMMEGWPWHKDDS